MKSASLSSLLLPLLLLGQLSLCASLQLTRRVAVGSAVGALGKRAALPTVASGTALEDMASEEPVAQAPRS